MRSRLAFVLVIMGVVVTLGLRADDPANEIKIGLQPDGRIVVPTNQILEPAGTQITFPGRPVDLAFAEDGRTLVVKNMRDLIFIDTATTKIKQTLATPVTGTAKPGLSVVGLLVAGNRVYTSDVQNNIRVAERQKDGSYKWLDKAIKLQEPAVGGAAHPAGLASLNADEMWVTSTRGNNVQLFDRSTGQVEQIVPVGVAPFTAIRHGPERLYVSNWGGDHPKEGEPQELSSGTPVRVDPRTSIANHGSVSVLAALPGKWKQIRTIEVGVHPCGMTLSAGGKFLYVANAASDTVSVIDTSTDTVKATIACRPEGRLPFGSGCNALALSPDGGTLYVANGTNNCIAVVTSRRAGTRRTGRWNRREDVMSRA